MGAVEIPEKGMTATSEIDSALSVPLRARVAAGLLLIAFVLQASIAAVRDSVTIDEFGSLPAGLYALVEQDPSAEEMNPPFFRAFEALPLLPARPVFHTHRGMNHWEMGYEFMLSNAAVYQPLFVLGRCMVILAAAALGALLFRWGCELYGWQGGLVSLFFFSFSPTVLAYAHLVTLDLAGCLGFTLALYVTWRFLERPTWGRGAILGVFLAMSLCFKLTNLVLLGAIPTIIAIRAARDRRVGIDPGAGFWLASSLGALAVAVIVLNLLYEFDGTLAPLERAPFSQGHAFAALRDSFPWLRLPLPHPWLRSIDLVLAGDQPQEPTYFLAGQLSQTGWWYYHLVAFLLKTPLPLLTLSLFALGRWIAGYSTARRGYCLFIPILVLFAANSIANPLDIGTRHTFPALPLFFLAVSPIISAPLTAVALRSRAAATVSVAALSAAFLLWHAAESLSVAPRYLQYFNQMAGGPQNGHKWLIDSNLDWGQDLIRLSEYMKRRGLSSINLAYFGRVDPLVYGIHFGPVVRGQSQGPTAVSVSFLMGRPYWIWRAPDRPDWARAGEFMWLQTYQPVDRVGSMFIFDLPQHATSSLRGGGEYRPRSLSMRMRQSVSEFSVAPPC